MEIMEPVKCSNDHHARGCHDRFPEKKDHRQCHDQFCTGRDSQDKRSRDRVSKKSLKQKS